ncbi:ABC transporter substrate-binding protein [Bradyrhizobium sp. JYMT SZCCT0428]|uniref:ABC transporter substrate-binding protein n=1 Tax=Bradyrhizobium sp. JYMT SZCCT0428 TaxID=2807673 RepID=UPI001BAAFAAE|nr:ABC transporter substrate-binding protein [Bradyrhizobium sp. JYMT SZCCT0428]MBR1157306.1 ABC transporter substrate-binding protein [Bradyrhizobium sp. JYMT SZCCT0428]
MRRREFIALLGGTAATWPLAAHAQQPAVPMIGVLSAGSPDPGLTDIEAAFERGLAEKGYVAGRNVTIERRWAGGNYDRLPPLAQELVRLNPALIRVGGNVVALAARRATTTIPIVFNIASDPVKLGLAKSFAHPGGNATGISILTATLTLKRLELIRELLPQNATLGFLVNPDNQDLLLEIEDVARSTGQSLEVAKARNPADLEPAFARLVRAQVGAVLVSNDALFLSQRVQLIALAKRHSLPATYEFREFPAVGGLMSYGPSLPETLKKVGTYAALILKGAQPSDLPIQQPTAFELVINLATARSLGITIPPSFLLRADEVIE